MVCFSKIIIEHIITTIDNKEINIPDTFVNNLLDPVGAGDALLAYSTLSMLASKSLIISAILGSIAAACECEYDGNIPVKSSAVLSKINEIEKKINYFSK